MGGVVVLETCHEIQVVLYYGACREIQVGLVVLVPVPVPVPVCESTRGVS
jgi:hypothetical protein